MGVGDGITVMYSFVHVMQDMYTCEHFRVNVTEDFSRLFKQIQDLLTGVILIAIIHLRHE